MEVGDILLVGPNKTTLKVCNINSNISFKIERKNNESGENQIALETLFGRTELDPRTSKTSKTTNDCLLVHDDAPGGSIEVSQLLSILVPSLQVLENSNEALNNSLPVERDVPDREFNQEYDNSESGQGGNMSVNTEMVNRIINARF